MDAAAATRRMHEAVAVAVASRGTTSSGGSAAALPPDSAMSKEIALLVKTLEGRNEQIRHLKDLLRRVAGSGMVAGGVPPPPPTMAALGEQHASDSSHSPSQQPHPGDDTAAAVPCEPPHLRGLGSEDHRMTETIRARLEAENSLLNRRCTEVILDLAGAKERIVHLEAEAQGLRFRDDQRANEHELKGQLQLLRDELLRERRRSLRLKNELDVLTDRSNEAVRRQQLPR